MSSLLAGIAALALVCAAMAILLWQRSARSQHEANAARFIESSVVAPKSPVAQRTSTTTADTRRTTADARRPATNVSEPGIGARAAARIARAFDDVATRAGLGDARKLAVSLCAATVAISAWVALDAGALAATAASVACLSAACFVISVRMQRRRLSIVQQLPTLLDGIVRLVTLGNSVPAAFQASLQTTEAPLRECMDRISRAMRAGIEIDRAFGQVAELYGVREFEFVGSVLRLSVKYGGRADVMLERMSLFMRDLEQAERELVAMSAETRMSAWVLAVLPLAIGGFLIASNPTYFGAMWADSTGRALIYVAFGLQMAGGYMLYRLTRLRS
ncbi:type II secretion system F family protein [Trinickia symbiotica]